MTKIVYYQRSEKRVRLLQRKNTYPVLPENKEPKVRRTRADGLKGH